MKLHGKNLIANSFERQMKLKRWLTATIFHISIIMLWYFGCFGELSVVQSVRVTFNIHPPYSVHIECDVETLSINDNEKLAKHNLSIWMCCFHKNPMNSGDMTAHTIWTKVFNDHVDGCYCFSVPWNWTSAWFDRIGTDLNRFSHQWG